jgi:hypothetical protein
MKIKLEMPSYDLNISSENESDDLTLPEIIEMFKQVLLAAGFHSETVDSISLHVGEDE